jgi:hypothetical protein
MSLSLKHKRKNHPEIWLWSDEFQFSTKQTMIHLRATETGGILLGGRSQSVPSLKFSSLLKSQRMSEIQAVFASSRHSVRDAIFLKMNKSSLCVTGVTSK